MALLFVRQLRKSAHDSQQMITGTSFNTVFRRSAQLAALLLLIALCDVTAKPESDATAAQPKDKDAESEWLLLPRLSFTPETGFLFGAYGQFVYRAQPDLRYSNISAGAAYSTKDQFEVFLSPSWYLAEDSYHLAGEILYRNMSNEFFGIGNDTRQEDSERYTERSLDLRLDAQRTLFDDLRGGIRVEYNSSSLLETEDEGLLATGELPGTNDPTVVGLGLLASWDSRDNIFFPTTGAFSSQASSIYDSSFGSDLDFVRGTLDIRHYFRIDSSTVFAFRILGDMIDGGPPFSRLAQLGGEYLLRGYFKGRYRDRNLLALQIEYRFPIWWRFGGVAFASVGEVAGRLKDFRIRDSRFAAGVGMRIKLLDSGFHGRIDIGYGRNGFGGPYIIGLEAF